MRKANYTIVTILTIIIDTAWDRIPLSKSTKQSIWSFENGKYSCAGIRDILLQIPFPERGPDYLLAEKAEPLFIELDLFFVKVLMTECLGEHNAHNSIGIGIHVCRAQFSSSTRSQDYCQVPGTRRTLELASASWEVFTRSWLRSPKSFYTCGGRIYRRRTSYSSTNTDKNKHETLPRE